MVFAFLKFNPKFLNKWDIDGGNYNGYVAFDADLYPATGDDLIYDELSNKIDVHGGVTFNDTMDCFKDTPLLPLTNLPDINELFTKKYRVIGFDTMHAYDTENNCSISFMKEETMRMYDQVVELIYNK